MTDTSTALSAPLYGASFGQAVSRFLKKYATFSGRASRSEYWWVALFLWIVYTVFAILIGSIGVATGTPQADGSVLIGPAGIALAVVFGIVALAFAIPGIALTVRRLHDGNFSGWFYLFHIIGLSIVVFILTLLESKPEGARFDK